MSSNKAIPRETLRIGHERALTAEGARQLDGIVRDHHSQLLRHVYHRVRSWADARDIVQQIYLHCLNSGGLRSVTNVRAYLYRSVENLANDWQRKSRVRESFAREQPLRSPTSVASAEEICEEQQELERLLQRIDDLPQQCRAAVLMVRCEGLSVDETAAKLRIKPKSVRGHIRRAMKYLLATVAAENLAVRDRL